MATGHALSSHPVAAIGMKGTPMRGKALWLIIGIVLIGFGGWLAHTAQTANGVTVSDIRFRGAAGNTMSALLYVPRTATAQTPAPAILAVHGYINSRETQSSFAIEFARRGYVVLALDQTGHGYSDPPASAHGFGGPDGLAYLRGLDVVDTNNIGLEGHSMGGWAVLAAAAQMPQGYRAMVLVGSATGKPFAADGTPSWPRNVAVVFGQYDEFSDLMWGVGRGREVAASPKLWALFGSTGAVEPGRVYGEFGKGTARALYLPAVSHPGEHLSRTAVAASLDWFARTLRGGRPLPTDDQLWPRKEAGTALALIGFLALLIGVFDALLALPAFAPLRRSRTGDAAAISPPQPAGAAKAAILVLSALVPALTYYPALALGGTFVTPMKWLPQAITNQILVWALVNAVIALALVPFVPKRARAARLIVPSVAIAAITVIAGLIALRLTDILFKADFRFWVVALKPMSPTQWLIFAIYVVPFTAFFAIALHVLHRNFSRPDAARAGAYLTSLTALTLGFVVLLAVQYGALWIDGRLINPLPDPAFVPLATILAIQFVPLLAAVAVVSTFTFRRTGSSLPGALICGAVVTWYVVAGTATQAAL
jgi:pimeloyl-ACP methyl ester carboxylesterase